MAAVILAAGLSAWALSTGHTAAPPAHRHGSSGTTTTSVATTTTSTSTTTTAPTPGSAAAALVRDAEAGVAAGTLSSGASKTILDDLNQALSASSSGDQSQVSTAIASMQRTIANQVQSGTMPPAEASTLEADVATLATALGATTSPTTTTTQAGSTGSTGNTGNTGAGTTTPRPRAARQAQRRLTATAAARAASRDAVTRVARRG